MKSFVTTIVDAFDVDSGAVRVATVFYSTGARVKVLHHLNTYKTAAEIKKAILGKVYEQGGTATGR